MEHETLTAEQRAELTENLHKQFNYIEKKSRLKKVMSYKFFLEATFIEYAIIEDRVESFLRHSGVFNPKIPLGTFDKIGHKFLSSAFKLLK